jgi:hypothetical protein
MWAGARESGDPGLARQCSDGEGQRVVVHGDRRGGGWRRKGIGGDAQWCHNHQNSTDFQNHFWCCATILAQWALYPVGVH